MCSVVIRCVCIFLVIILVFYDMWTGTLVGSAGASWMMMMMGVMMMGVRLGLGLGNFILVARWSWFGLVMLLGV